MNGLGVGGGGGLGGGNSMTGGEFSPLKGHSGITHLDGFGTEG